ncbi:hypothetical protein H5410_047471 [Solanum commersonii]|uniref:C2H2-type domain-containing protein n=1 Tax=Solanum commersonii TaxID=4109 RepID=A0A9J5XH57_SOLCO|nr:hypothetical protein H5410_047471 [Solanum commersonii]
MVETKKPLFCCFNWSIRFITYQYVEVEPSQVPLQPLSTTRHKCLACYKQCKRKEHIIEHMQTSHHSVHDPTCGPLAKVNCSSIFAERGCILCLKICSSVDSLNEHKEMCHLTTPQPIRYCNVSPPDEDQFRQYDIQVGFHDPYQNAVSVMQLYKRMCSQDHPMVWVSISPGQLFIGCSNPWKSMAHERMTIEELLAISRANYQCWCLDSQD